MAALPERTILEGLKVPLCPTYSSALCSSLLTDDRHQFFFLCQVFYVPATTLLKVSVGLFLLRISTRKVHIWSIRITMIATGLFGLYFFIVTVLQCRPLSNYWTV